MSYTDQLRPFGNSGLYFYPLGIGTIWFGRKWPPDNSSYKFPDTEEIKRYLCLCYKKLGNNDGVIMLDTAAAYGHSERLLGEFLEANPQYISKTFVATKWGEEFCQETETSRVDHSLASLHNSLKKSLHHLSKVDLLYIHKTDARVLRDDVVVNEMGRLKKERYGGIRLIGASISDEMVLKTAVEEKSFLPFDAFQIPAQLFLKRPDLTNVLSSAGKAIVLNSPIRKSENKDPKACYTDLLNRPDASIILTGTRNHLNETLGYMAYWPKCGP